MPTIKEWFTKNALKWTGLIKTDLPSEENRLTFVCNIDEITRNRIHEYNIWYEGSSDELLNFYTASNTISYNYEPWYDRNKKNYFWAINSTEGDIKRTHSGQPRNIVDTIVGIVDWPLIKGEGIKGNNDNSINNNLQYILKKNGLRKIYKKQQLPLTLIEGWGCYKINFDKDFLDVPTVAYYRADNVEFVYKQSQLIGIMFKDYYVNGKKTYMLTETRRFEIRKNEKTGESEKYLIVENKLFDVTSGNSQYVTPVDFNNVPELIGTPEYIEFGPGMNWLFAVPCIIFENTAPVGGYGRSIFQGKLDLFDDLDQCLSQAANAVRKSTPIEYFNSEFLERDKNGMPKQPHAYDRKYTVYRGSKDADGVVQGDAVQVTQPSIDFKQYSEHAVEILLQIINGVISPATLGIDIAKKDNAEAQREKQKVTIFTRNLIIEEEREILNQLCVQLLAAYEYMQKGEITVQDYDISVKFSAFADDSFENKLEKLGAAFDAENISETMYIDKLYGDTIPEEEKQRELDWLKEHHTKPRDEGMQGMAGDGENTPGMLDNMMGGDGEEDI